MDKTGVLAKNARPSPEAMAEFAALGEEAKRCATEEERAACRQKRLDLQQRTRGPDAPILNQTTTEHHHIKGWWDPQMGAFTGEHM